MTLGARGTGLGPGPRAVALALALLCTGGAAQAADDPWWGRDKALHLGAGTAISVAGYAASSRWVPERPARFAIGTGLALGAGAGKEGWDALGHGDPSWRDFAWTAVGALLGSVLSLSVDLATAR